MKDNRISGAMALMLAVACGGTKHAARPKPTPPYVPLSDDKREHRCAMGVWLEAWHRWKD